MSVVLVVDSGVWIDFFRGARHAATEALESALAAGDVQILVPDLVLFELLRGFRSERDLLDARRLLEALGIVSMGGYQTVTRAADRYRQLRATGYTVRSSVDALLASWCLDHDYLLLHRDRDFTPYVDRFGLRVRPLSGA